MIVLTKTKLLRRILRYKFLLIFILLISSLSCKPKFIVIPAQIPPIMISGISNVVKFKVIKEEERGEVIISYKIIERGKDIYKKILAYYEGREGLNELIENSIEVKRYKYERDKTYQVEIKPEGDTRNLLLLIITLKEGDNQYYRIYPLKIIKKE